MPIDDSLMGRAFPPTEPYEVTAESVTAFAEALGAPSGSVPPTYPVVVTFRAMLGFLAAEQLELSRIVHGDQRFRYARPVRIGDRLTATLSVTSHRRIGGNDIIATASELTDAEGALVCTATATLVHRGEAA